MSEHTQIDTRVLEVLRDAWLEVTQKGMPNRAANYTYPQIQTKIARNHGISPSPAKIGAACRRLAKDKLIHKWNAGAHHIAKVHVEYIPTPDEAREAQGHVHWRDAHDAYDACQERLSALLKRHGFEHASVTWNNHHNRFSVSLPLAQTQDFLGALERGLG